jgi:hypothetical protein
MTKKQAIDILSGLADGYNPATGEALERGNVCLNTNVRQALDVAVETLKKAVAREIKVNPVSAGSAWTPELDKELKALHKKNWTVKQLAERYDRTTGAIKSRLAKLNTI